MVIVKFIVIAIMVYITALFVAAEFALVKVRSSKLEQLVTQGEKKAVLALRLTHHLDDYLSACQLGITFTTLIIGGLGEQAVSHLLHPVIGLLPISSAVSLTISVVFSYILVTFVEVVIGELIPKSYSIAYSEKVVLSIARPLHIFFKLTYPFIKALNWSATKIGRLFGVKMVSEGEETLSEEELLLVASDSFSKGEINQEEFRYLSNIFDFDEQQAREIMTNRVDMEVLESDISVQEAILQALEAGHSRYPVIGESKDDVMGYVTLQDLVRQSYKDATIPLAKMVLTPIIAIETIPIKKLLKQMQIEHKHLSVLVDEYGGTSGLVTIEDILEEIVGDIQDEVDHEEAHIQRVSDQIYLIEGRTEVSSLERRFGMDELDDPNGNVSIGGYLTSVYQTEVEVGFTVVIQHFRLTVLEIENTVIQQIRFEIL